MIYLSAHATIQITPFLPLVLKNVVFGLGRFTLELDTKAFLAFKNDFDFIRKETKQKYLALDKTEEIEYLEPDLPLSLPFFVHILTTSICFTAHLDKEKQLRFRFVQWSRKENGKMDFKRQKCSFSQDEIEQFQANFKKIEDRLFPIPTEISLGDFELKYYQELERELRKKIRDKMCFE